MGYYTQYRLSKPDNLTLDQKKKLMEIQPSYFSEIKYVEDLYDNSEEMKWYDHEDDMVKLSEAFPEVLFQLEGNGEESDDQWIKYFKGGKMQTEHAVITFGEFDDTKLK